MISSAHYKPQFEALKEATRININATGQKLLDFGCGAGYLAQQYSYEAEQVIAYDITLHDTWNALKTQNLTFTTSIIDVQEEATYGKIIINDVFDHIEPPPKWFKSLHEYHVYILNMLTPLLTYGGTVTLVIHPWTSRFGAHLPEKKTFYHLTALGNYLNGKQTTPIHRILKSEEYYTKCIDRSNLKIAEVFVDKKELEPFELHLLPTISKNLGVSTDVLSDIISVNKIYYTLNHR